MTKQQLNRRARDRARHVKEVMQVTINAVLWQIIKQNTPAEEGEPVPDGIITVPLDDLSAVPKNFALSVVRDEGTRTVRIMATVHKPKSNIVLPGDDGA
jgi:hypothetical protein